MCGFIKTKLLLLMFFTAITVGKVMAVSKPVVEGTDYTVISGVPVTNEPKGVVNVKEFFAFSCIHCKDIEPMVEKNFASNKKIDLEKIHVAWEENSLNFAKFNATISLLNLNNLYIPAFNAVFDRQNLTDQTVLKGFLGKNGLSKAQIDKFMSTYNSFTVNSKAAEAKNLTTMYNITATPTFIVADKYEVKSALPDRLIEVIQELVKKAAADK
ncbi:MAG: hypothetical protein QG673_862 [Pseudomonadota bacterium]|nr:hypothetical protein [Pseudomonadota bacterium]